MLDAWLVKCPTRPSAHFNIKIPSDCKAGSRRFSNLQIVKTTCVLYHPRLSSSTIFHPWHIFLSKERDCRAGIKRFLIIQFAREKHFFIIKCFHPPKSFIINLSAFDDFGTMNVHFNKKHSSSQETKPYLTSVFRWQETTFKNRIMNNTILQHVTLPHLQYSIHAEMWLSRQQTGTSREWRWTRGKRKR